MLLLSKQKDLIYKDTDRWMKCSKYTGYNGFVNTAYLLIFVKEYRNLFYKRVGSLKYLLYYLPRESTLFVRTSSKNIGEGLFIQHGYATGINAKKIGKNCWINQQVSIGYSGSKSLGYGNPTIGDNVRISTGAKVFGPITIGDNSVIGANAVITKDVPPNSVIVPAPMRFIYKDGIRVNETF